MRTRVNPKAGERSKKVQAKNGWSMGSADADSAEVGERVEVQRSSNSNHKSFPTNVISSHVVKLLTRTWFRVINSLFCLSAGVVAVAAAAIRVVCHDLFATKILVPASRSLTHIRYSLVLSYSFGFQICDCAYASVSYPIYSVARQLSISHTFPDENAAINNYFMLISSAAHTNAEEGEKKNTKFWNCEMQLLCFEWTEWRGEQKPSSRTNSDETDKHHLRIECATPTCARELFTLFWYGKLPRYLIEHISGPLFSDESRDMKIIIN